MTEIQTTIKEDLKNLVSDIISLNFSSKDNTKSNIYNFRLVPKFIYEGLNCNIITEERKKATLKEIWQDSSLYDSIIDYYMANLWGIECLCKKVKVEYNGDPLKI